MVIILKMTIEVMASIVGMMILFSGMFFVLKSDKTAHSTEEDLFEAFRGLKRSGLLRKENTGFIYVDVDDDFIWRGFEFVKKFGFQEPSYFGEGLVGAHIFMMDA